MFSGAQLAKITREIVQIKSQSYGKGATEAKAYQCDDFLLVVLKGGMTTVEQHLLEHGEQRLVREVRLRYQENNGEDFKGAVERIGGHRVLTYQSQVIFARDYSVEIFVLGDADGVASTQR